MIEYAIGGLWLCAFLVAACVAAWTPRLMQSFVKLLDAKRTILLAEARRRLDACADKGGERGNTQRPA